MQYLLLLVSITFGSCKQLHYHRDVGIPLATKIKATEEILAKEPGDNKIAGGEVAPLFSHPYFAGLIITFVNIEDFSSCGSTLISANRVVTAAHCYSDENSDVDVYIVVLGSNFLFSGGQRITTSHIVAHPEYDPKTLDYDIAVIYLPTKVSFSDSIQPASLPENLSETFVGDTATASGYGLIYEGAEITSDAVLMHVDLTVISQEECEKTYGPISSNIMCTSGEGGVGVCAGDSGGPLIVKKQNRDVLVGVISFNVGKCGIGPGGYSRITSSYDFIHEHLSSSTKGAKEEL